MWEQLALFPVKGLQTAEGPNLMCSIYFTTVLNTNAYVFAIVLLNFVLWIDSTSKY